MSKRTVTIPYEEYQELLSSKKEEPKHYGFTLYSSLTGYTKSILYTKEEADKELTDTIKELREENEKLKSRNIWQRMFNI